MQCTNCGKELTENDTFCSNCGTAVKNVAMPEEPKYEDVTNHFNSNTVPSVPVETPQQQTVVNNEVATPTVQPTLAPVQEVPIEVVKTETPTTPTVAPLQPAPAETPVVAPEAQPVVEQPTVVQDQPATQPAVQETAPAQPAQEASTEQQVPKTELQPPPSTEPTNLGNPAVAQVMGSDFANKDVIPSGGVNYGPAPIVDPPQTLTELAQPPVNNSVPAGPRGPKKGFGGAVVVVIVLISSVLFIGLGIFVGSIMFGGSAPKKTGGDEPIQTQTGAVVTVTFGGAKFNIPDDYYDYDLADEKLAIYNDDIYFYIMLAPKSYAQYNSNIPYLKQYYEGLNYTVSSAKEVKVVDQRYVTIDMENITGKVTLFIRPFTNSQSLTGAIAKTTDSFATSKDLSDVEAILSTSQIVTKAIQENKQDLYKEVLRGIIEAEFDDASEEKAIQ